MILESYKAGTLGFAICCKGQGGEKRGLNLDSLGNIGKSLMPLIKFFQIMEIIFLHDF
jgi:hypothetical protein